MSDVRCEMPLGMSPSELSERAMIFALRILKFAEALPRTAAGRNVADQVVRSACSVAANYRAAQRSKSRADFKNKIAIVLEKRTKRRSGSSWPGAEVWYAPREPGISGAKPKS